MAVCDSPEWAKGFRERVGLSSFDGFRLPSTQQAFESARLLALNVLLRSVLLRVGQSLDVTSEENLSEEQDVANGLGGIRIRSRTVLHVRKTPPRPQLANFDSRTKALKPLSNMRAPWHPRN